MQTGLLLFIVGILGFIGYELHKWRLERKEERADENIKDLMPHLYAEIKRNGREELRNYIAMYLAGKYASSGYKLRSLIAKEGDEEERKNYEKKHREMFLEMSKEVETLKKEKEITTHEIQFLIESFCNNEVETYPNFNTLRNFLEITLRLHDAFPSISSRDQGI